MSQPTELHSQAAALAFLADLTENAIAAGAVMAPTWNIPSSCLISGYLRPADDDADDTALRALEEWRQLLGAPAAISSQAFISPSTGAAMTEWRVQARCGELRIWLSTSVPASVRATASAAGIAVAA
jgi:hypothetical protein